ncbi:unnamed protein product [Durusdinium trenchii]|uniref:Uncharacterized protein n=1 Tax=Durusdinium trenchii TaxID=1381693 RepID=A0ABP0H715_9DINO
MRWREVPTASFDIRFHEEGQEGKVSPAMDLLSDAGFELALLTVLNAKMGSFLAVIGLVCRSFVTISSGTHKRTPWRPLGDERVAMVQEGNGLLSRVTLLIMVISAMGGCWLLEQPRTSLILYHPRTRHLWRLLPKVYSASWWMGLYNALTPKRHIAFSNATAVKLLDLGTMSREATPSQLAAAKKKRAERPVATPARAGSKMQLEIEKLKVELEQAKGAPAAKMARLRRVCERKPSGKLMVPEEVHNRWRTANHDERVAMCDELEAAGKDIYNKNLEKFYVVVDENDTDVSEDEEVEQNIKEETVPQLPSSALACHVG